MYKNRINAKRTKIVATIGPSSSNEQTLRQMIGAGLDVARINFSHNKHDDHARSIALIRRVADEENALVAILADIQGPKIRIGAIDPSPLMLNKGDRITLTLEAGHTGANNTVTIPHPEFVKDVKRDATLLIDDGNLEFVVTAATGSTLICEVVVGGQLTSRKGVMATNARLTMEAITAKDREDIVFAASQGVDYIAMSFVRNAHDIREMQYVLRYSTEKGAGTPIIAKIEKHEALEVIDEIIAVADGIMVARGDLGLEIPAEQVPFWQKQIIHKCNAASKPVITATQMLSSMVDNPRPTRAEASDVYNAILDGTDAVMLSNETAAGSYPVQAVRTMFNIATIAERDVIAKSEARTIAQTIHRVVGEGEEAISDVVCQATCAIADALNIKAIVTSTLSGYTARHVAKERPRTPILCVTPHEHVYRRMILVWGVHPLLIPMFGGIDDMVRSVVKAAHDTNLVSAGDSLALIAGVPFAVGGQTNFMKIHTVGEMGELTSDA